MLTHQGLLKQLHNLHGHPILHGFKVRHHHPHGQLILHHLLHGLLTLYHLHGLLIPSNLLVEFKPHPSLDRFLPTLDIIYHNQQQRLPSTPTKDVYLEDSLRTVLDPTNRIRTMMRLGNERCVPTIIPSLSVRGETTVRTITIYP